MGRRLPRPNNPTRQRCELDDSELRELEIVAARCRLSVASFIRVALVDAAAHPERVPDWQAVAARLAVAADPGRRKPGRPPKADPPGPKKGKGRRRP